MDREQNINQGLRMEAPIYRMLSAMVVFGIQFSNPTEALAAG
jgi:hypothetical protein